MMMIMHQIYINECRGAFQRFEAVKIYIKYECNALNEDKLDNIMDRNIIFTHQLVY